MRDIIKGKMYNTETANYIGYARSKEGVTSFNWYRESLYQKKTGEFFLAGEGNAMSKYARSVGSGFCWEAGEGIIPLSLEEAKEWVTENLTVDDYIDLFGEPEE